MNECNKRCGMISHLTWWIRCGGGALLSTEKWRNPKKNLLFFHCYLLLQVRRHRWVAGVASPVVRSNSIILNVIVYLTNFLPSPSSGLNSCTVECILLYLLLMITRYIYCFGESEMICAERACDCGASEELIIHGVIYVLYIHYIYNIASAAQWDSLPSRLIIPWKCNMRTG